jgi:hypothetical protein
VSFSLNLPLRGNPCGKHRFYDRSSAEMARCDLVDRNTRERTTSARAYLRIYWCDRCQAHHLGHFPKA